MSTTDKIKNAIDDVAGIAKEIVGKFGGDRKTENEGRAEQSTAHLKKAGENVKDAFKA
jgi:uncharacterized protein YjbJ (UPF0337 family)